MAKRPRPSQDEPVTPDRSLLHPRRRPDRDQPPTVTGSHSSRLKYKDTSSSRPSIQKRRKATLTLPDPLSLEGSISEEVLLRCLSFLDAHDLVTVARVSSAWHRLAHDPQLWRSLYLRTYASASSRRQASYGGTIARSRPWKDLYKISTNWRNGCAKSTTVPTKTVRKAVLARVPTDLSLSGDTNEPTSRVLGHTTPHRDNEDLETLLQVHRHYFFSAVRGQVASDLVTDPPDVTVSHTLPSGTSQFLASFSSQEIANYYSTRPDFRPPLTITELRLDESASSCLDSLPCIHLSVFYNTGQFSIFEVHIPTTQSPFSVREVYTSLAIVSTLATDYSSTKLPFESVALARFHYPLLVTCSNSFTLRFFQLSNSVKTGKLEVQESETPLKTRDKWAPVALSLEKVKTRKRDRRSPLEKDPDVNFKASLCYSLPVFPNEWTVGMQEFSINLSTCRTPSRPIEISTIQASSVLPRTVESNLSSLTPSTRYTSPFSPPSSLATTSRRGRNPTSPITSIEYSNPFIVTSRNDNTIQVYRVIPSCSSRSLDRVNSNHSRMGRNSEERTLLRRDDKRLAIRFEKTLFGHTARVGSVALMRRTDFEEDDDGDDDDFLTTTTTTTEEGEDHVTSSRNEREKQETLYSSQVRHSDQRHGRRRRATEVGRRKSHEESTKIVSAGDDGSFKVWSLSKELSSSSSPSKRRRRDFQSSSSQNENEKEEEEVIDIYSTMTSTSRTTETESNYEEGMNRPEPRTTTKWQKMKEKRGRIERRTSTPHPLFLDRRVEEEEADERVRRPERIKKILVDHDKIVVLGCSRSSSSSSAVEGGGGCEEEKIRVLSFN